MTAPVAITLAVSAYILYQGWKTGKIFGAVALLTVVLTALELLGITKP